MALKQRIFGNTFCSQFGLALATLALLPNASAAQELQLCAQAQFGLVVAIPADQDCSNLPGQWMSLNLGSDDDWAGAGTGSLHLGHPADRVGIGLDAPAAKLHVLSDRGDPDALVIERAGSRHHDLTVTGVGEVIVGGQSGSNARLTVNAPADEPVLRARAGGMTALFVGSDGQVGVRTAQPQAALQVNGTAAEDILQLRRHGVGEPAVIVDRSGNVGIDTAANGTRLAVRNDNSGRAGFFEIDNPNNNSAAIAAVTNGGGTAILARTLSSNNGQPTINAIHNGPGRAGRFIGDVTVSRDLGIGSSITNPATSLHIEGDNDGTDVLVHDSEFARMRLHADEQGNEVRLSLQARSSATVERAEIGTLSPHPMVLYTGGQTRIVLETDGSVCIGNC